MARIAAQSENDWRRVHHELSRLARLRAGLDAEEGTWLLRAERCRVHAELGYGSFAEYIERLFGYDAQTTREKLRVASALDELPVLSRALSNGEVSWSAVRELTRVATLDTETEWLSAARGKTVRQVEKQVAGRTRGARPDDPADPGAMRHVLHFDVSAETLATFREAMDKLRRDAGSSLDHDAALLLMARHVLGGPTDEGRSSYQVLVTVCEHCGRGRQQAGGEELPLAPEILEMASCDAQRVSASHVGRDNGASHVGRKNKKRKPMESQDPKRPRAAQDIPPAVRREVMRRDRGCCVVPGCKNRVFVDVHHIDLRSEGGDHDPDGLVVLCSAHHRAVHAGKLSIEGSVSTGLAFRHAYGRSYGEPVSATAMDVWTKVFRGLRHLGFREGDTRRVLNELRSKAENAQAPPSAEQLLRAALLVLT